jgi:hypothetical protein
MYAASSFNQRPDMFIVRTFIPICRSLLKCLAGKAKHASFICFFVRATHSPGQEYQSTDLFLRKRPFADLVRKICNDIEQEKREYDKEFDKANKAYSK